MPSYVIKASPDQDWYVYWSTIVDAPIAFGTRAEVLTDREVTEERVARADAAGTSNLAGTDFGWDDPGFICMEVQPCPPGVLPREHLREFVETFASADPAVRVTATRFLTPFEDYPYSPAQRALFGGAR